MVPNGNTNRGFLPKQKHEETSFNIILKLSTCLMFDYCTLSSMDVNIQDPDPQGTNYQISADELLLYPSKLPYKMAKSSDCPNL